MSVAGHQYAPIAVFAYNRPAHLSQTLQALARNPEAAQSDVTIFCDGAKSEMEVSAVLEARRIAKDAIGFRSQRVVERSVNMGLARSIVEGVSEVVAHTGKIIVLEDDLVTAPFFLRYMNEALDLYAEQTNVASVHGYVYPVDGPLPETFFMRGADCWGWATWARAWTSYEPDAVKLLRELRETGQVDDFDFGGAAGYIAMLENFIAGKNNSWAVRWHAATYLRRMLTLYPGRSLVRNIGFDGSGTHSGDLDTFDSGLYDQPVVVDALDPTENEQARAAFARYFASRHPTILQRLHRRARRVLGLSPIAPPR